MANVTSRKSAPSKRDQRGDQLAKRFPHLPPEQVYPAVVSTINLNCCGDPDCGNYGVAPNFDLPTFKGPNADERLREATASIPALLTGLGAYIQGPLKDSYDRVSSILDFYGDPHMWTDGRALICQHVKGGSVCGIQHMVLSNEHYEKECQRLRSHNGIFADPKCGHCGQRYFEKPDEFVFNGQNVRKGADHRSVRLIHKPCRGEKGARFTISAPHVQQRDKSDNREILKLIVDSGGINGIQRALRDDNGYNSAGIDRIYDRIFWLERTLLAFEKAQLSEWRKRLSAEGRFRHTHVAHDDIVLSANWESSKDRRITPLNCSVSSDIESGYVFRIDVDFDPTVDPTTLVKSLFLDPDNFHDAVRRVYTKKSGEKFVAPKLSFQRPTGRYDEPALFASAISQLRLFAAKVAKASKKVNVGISVENQKVIAEAYEDASMLEGLAKYYLGFGVNDSDVRNNFSGIMTRDTYTKAAHLTCLKEMLPPGKLTLVGEQEGTMARVVPHIFREEIQNDAFEWHIVNFDKTVKKDEIMRRTSAYDRAFRAYRTEHPLLEVGEALHFFTKERMVPAHGCDATGKPAPFASSLFVSAAYPELWVRSPLQVAGETNKVVGFPILSARYRSKFRQLKLNEDIQDTVLRSAITRRVINATMQPTSSFMNSLRDRLSYARRATGGSKRSGGTYINGACYNPRILIALLNIFRVHYNFFEPRQYVSPLNKHLETEYVETSLIKMKVPGTQETVSVPKRRRLAPVHRTPAMRAGIQHTQRDDAKPATPSLEDVLYQPWEFYGTDLWLKLNDR